jgi:hypothetical protein
MIRKTLAIICVELASSSIYNFSFVPVMISNTKLNSAVQCAAANLGWIDAHYVRCLCLARRPTNSYGSTTTARRPDETLGQTNMGQYWSHRIGASVHLQDSEMERMVLFYQHFSAITGSIILRAE